MDVTGLIISPKGLEGFQLHLLSNSIGFVSYVCSKAHFKSSFFLSFFPNECFCSSYHHMWRYFSILTQKQSNSLSSNFSMSTTFLGLTFVTTKCPILSYFLYNCYCRYNYKWAKLSCIKILVLFILFYFDYKLSSSLSPKKLHILSSFMAEYCIKWSLFVLWVLFKLIWQNEERCEFR